MGIPWFCFAGRYLLCKTYEVDNAGFDQHFDRTGSCAKASSFIAQGGSRGVTQAASAPHDGSRSFEAGHLDELDKLAVNSRSSELGRNRFGFLNAQEA
jgi:hypothetical protein